jgi:hypothetical protein
VSDLTPDADPYDVAEVAAAARAADPGLPDGNARVLAEEAARYLRDGAEDAPDLARRLLAAHPEWGATAANVVARAACLASGVAP